MVGGLSMLVTSLIIAPFALDGDAATETGGSAEAIAVVSAISIIGGYLLLFALWRYVFSEKAKVKRREPPDRPDRR
jgi:hypothetical protein